MSFPVAMKMSGLRDRRLNLYPSLWETSKAAYWAREHFIRGRPVMLQSHLGFPPHVKPHIPAAPQNL